ncbi:MAG TPA: response regulator transcription factor [Acidobacteriaceae bacterium]|nr:response regulator transcription factor [Acidobacteriaceae bacterium]
MTVLIVEDNDGIRRLLRRALFETASIVLECRDGADALDAYTRHRPDVVLMDVRMPRLDGLTATRQIRQFDPSAKIVIVTDYDDDDLRAAAVEAGACDYALKQNLAVLPVLIRSVGGMRKA